MVIQSMKGLYEVGKGLPARRVAVVHPYDQTVLEALGEGAALGLCQPILLGARNIIEKAASLADFSLEGVKVLDIPDGQEAAHRGARLVRDGEADMIMKGLASTAQVIRGVLAKENELRTGSLLSHITALQVPDYHKLVYITDAGININPDLSGKVEIVKNAIKALQSLGIRRPKVAVIAAIEHVNPAMQSGIDAALLSKMGDRGQLGEAVVDGPLSLDLALINEVAGKKGVPGEVAGDADLLLISNVETANILCKVFMKWAHTPAAGCVIGAKCPVALLSRVDSKENRLNSLALARALTVSAGYNP